MKKLFAIILSLGLILAPMPVVNTAHAGGAGGYAKIILGMANGIIGSTIITKCKMTFSQPSLILYLSGSLVYVAAEILAGKGKAKSTEENSKQLDELKASMKEGGDYQKAAVQAQIDNEKDNLKHIQKKRKFMMATKIIYSLAAIAAMVEFILSLPPPPAGIGIGKPDAGMCSPDGVSHLPMEGAIVMAYKAAQGYASGGMMGAIAAAAMPQIMKFLGQQKLADTVVDKAVSALNSGLGRVAVFLAAAALVFVIDASLKKDEDRSKQIIADLEKVKATFEKADNNLAEGESTSGSGNQSGSLGGEGDDPTKKTYAVKALAKGTELAKHCFANSSAGMSYSESNCSNSLKIKKPVFDANMEIGTLTAGSNSAIDMAQAISDGDLARADTAAANLNAMAGRIDSVKNNLLKKVDEQLKKSGKKPIDIKGQLNSQLTALNNALNQQNPGSGNYTMADLEAGDAAVSSDVANAEDLKAGEITTASAPAAAPIGDSAIDLSKIDVDESGAGVDPNAAGTEKVASLEDSLGQYESNENDISKDPGVSIFKQVSNRYILNYEKIFQRKQINPPLAEPQPSN